MTRPVSFDSSHSKEYEKDNASYAKTNAFGNSHLTQLIEVVYQGLIITPKQLLEELLASADLSDLWSGVLSFEALRLTAETLSITRYHTQLATSQSDSLLHYRRIEHPHFNRWHNDSTESSGERNARSRLSDHYLRMNTRFVKPWQQKPAEQN